MIIKSGMIFAAMAFSSVAGSVSRIDGGASGETRYLAASGDDARDGKTPETAWRTLFRYKKNK